MFNDRGYCNIIKCMVLETLQGALVMATGFNICGLYVLDGSTVIVHVLLSSQDFHDKNKLWHLRLKYVSERGLVEHFGNRILEKHYMVKV